MLQESTKEQDERWAEEKELYLEYQRRREAFALQERADAQAAVAKALAGYRWWGWTNIVNTIRLAIQAWRLRRAKKQ